MDKRFSFNKCTTAIHTYVLYCYALTLQSPKTSHVFAWKLCALCFQLLLCIIYYSDAFNIFAATYMYICIYDLIYIIQVYVFSSISFLSFRYVGTAGIMANFFLRHNIFLSKFFMFFCCHLFWWKLLVAIFIIYLYYTTFFYLLKNTYMYMYLCSSKNLCR